MPEAKQSVFDEIEIRNLLARFCQLSDDGSLEDYLDCMDEDAVWGGSGFPARRGHQEIREGAEQRRADGIAGPGSHTRHLISTTHVVVTGDKASARSIFSFFGNTHQKPDLLMMGVWEDEFRRTERGWKLAQRTIVREEE